MGKQAKAKKMSMAEFMAGTPSNDVDMLPSGPKQRGPDDDGSFRRNNNMRDSNRGGGSRNYNGRRDDYGEVGRGDEEQNWRRGGGVPQKEFSSRRRDDYGDSNRGDVGRGDEEQNWRRGTGVPQNRDRDRDNYRDRDNNRDRDEGPPSRADGDTSWRSGRSMPPPPPPGRNDRYGRDDPYSRSGSYRSSGPVERERPRLNLSKRTLPIEGKPATGGDTSSKDKKNDPFGGARAADTASKLSALEIKDDKKDDKEEPEKRPPSMPINSRAAALEAAPRSRDIDPRDDNRSMRRLDDRGPYDRDRGYDRRGNDRSFRRDDRGYDRDRGGRDDRGPYDRDRNDRWGRDDRGYDRDRGGYDNRSYRGRDDRGPYNDRDRQSRSYPSYEQQDRRSNRGFDDVRRNDDFPRRNENSDAKPSDVSRKEESFPPLAPPPNDPTPPPQQSTSSEQKQAEAAKEKAKKKEEEEKKAELERLKKEEEEKKRQEEELQKQKQEEELLQQFLSLRDNALLQFCEENESSLANQIETLTYSLFKEHNNASWTSTHKSALQQLIPPDSMPKQLDVLFAIQKYCDSINFPKENDKNAIHYYFEIMLAEDIVSPDSFFEWKDDENKDHEQGKTKAVIQTMDWFTFLEDLLFGDEEEYGDEEEGYDDEY